jgi:hypothetical protein
MQRAWRRYSPFTGTVPSMPSVGANAYRASLPIEYGFNGNYVFQLDHDTTSGEPVGDMTCSLAFFFVKKAIPIPTALARIWGMSQAVSGGENATPYLGVYLGEVEFTIGAAHGVPFISDPAKNVFAQDWYMASQIKVTDDRCLRPPGLAVVGSDRSLAPASSACVPSVVFDAMGFRRIAVSLRWAAATAASNGLGFFWRSA